MNDMPDIYDDMTDMYDDVTYMYEYYIYVWYQIQWGVMVNKRLISEPNTFADTFIVYVYTLGSNCRKTFTSQTEIMIRSNEIT